MGNTLECIGLGNDFLSRTQKAQHLGKNEQMGLYQTKELLQRKKKKKPITTVHGNTIHNSQHYSQ
jgi:hypothetical protein